MAEGRKPRGRTQELTKQLDDRPIAIWGAIGLIAFNITFYLPQMYYDFKGPNDEWNFDDSTYTASYTF